MNIKAFQSSILAAAVATACFSTNTHAHTTARADGHAPIAVMGDHLHKEGEWMVSYRYMHMDMADLMKGDDDISIDEALNDYMMVPKEMTMKMHMFGMMYAPTDDITLMFMTNYLDNEMDSVMRMQMSMDHSDGMGDMHSDMTDMDMDAGMNDMHNGMDSDMHTGMDDMHADMDNAMHTMTMDMQTSMSSSGFGDSRLGALIRGIEGENYRTHFNVGLNLPTGDIDVMHTNAMGKKVVSGYPMQLGTGTYNLFGAFTYVYQHQDWQYGFQANYETALDENDEDYKPGDKFLVHNWVSYSWAQSLSTSLRLSVTDKDNYSGMDDRLNPMMMPTADPKQRGGTLVDAAIGANYLFTDGALSGQRIAFEISTPISQDYDGIQMKTDWTATLGWQMAF
ncbi:transporter [Catenovulum sp. SM1970]|uniref:transporter n=1 Tax=Marinifaba aquimaris TaxID=2741323 RepID=UPI00157471E5|nr:transporter [Marinifaba aquimaris]NTS77073.1 transporter [Marinifaba aquimaris]